MFLTQTKMSDKNEQVHLLFWKYFFKKIEKVDWPTPGFEPGTFGLRYKYTNHSANAPCTSEHLMFVYFFKEKV